VVPIGYFQLCAYSNHTRNSTPHTFQQISATRALPASGDQDEMTKLPFIFKCFYDSFRMKQQHFTTGSAPSHHYLQLSSNPTKCSKDALKCDYLVFQLFAILPFLYLVTFLIKLYIITCLRGQQVLHSCAVFSVAFGLGNTYTHAIPHILLSMSP